MLPNCKYCGRFLNPQDENILCDEVYGHLGIDDIIYYHQECKPTQKQMNTELNEAAEKYAELKKEYDILQWSYDALFKKYEELAQWQLEQKQVQEQKRKTITYCAGCGSEVGNCDCPAGTITYYDDEEKWGSISEAYKLQEQKQVPTDEAIEKLAEKECKENWFEGNEFHFIKGFKSALQYPARAGWVKASERLPDKMKRYNGKLKGKPALVEHTGLIEGYMTANGNLERIEDVEWLDEEALQYSAGDGWTDVKDRKAGDMNRYLLFCQDNLLHYGIIIDQYGNWLEKATDTCCSGFKAIRFRPLPSPPINK